MSEEKKVRKTRKTSVFTDAKMIRKIRSMRLEGKKPAEIAEAFGISTGTASRYSRGLAKKAKKVARTAKRVTLLSETTKPAKHSQKDETVYLKAKVDVLMELLAIERKNK